MMKIIENEFITEIHGVSSLSELLEVREQLGKPCILAVYRKSSIRIGDNAEGTANFFRNAPFVTALVSEDNVGSDDVSALFDIVVTAEEFPEYTGKIFKDKTKRQADEITACFTAARIGGAEKSLECESRAFYRLMADKNGGSTNE